MSEQKFNFHAKALSEPGSSEPAPAPISSIELAQSVNRLDAKKELSPMEIKQIPRSRIMNNKKNTYPAATVNELADSILHYGLQQPLTVVYLLAEDVYILEAGHQRAAALDQLISTYKDGNFTENEQQLYETHVKSFERGYPCLVQARLTDDIDLTVYGSENIGQLPESVIDSEIRLIITNEVKRPDDPAVRAANVSRLAKLYARKNEGRQRADKINVNRQIAADLNITERQVANYKSLDKLIPELKEKFDRSNLSLKNSTLIAKLDEAEQRQILQLIQSGVSVKTDEISALLREKEKLLKQLKEKQDMIQSLSVENKALSENDFATLHDQQIKALQDEINALHAQSKQSMLSEHAGKLISADLKLRAAFSAAIDSLATLKNQIAEYQVLKRSDVKTEDYSTMNEDELLEHCETLASMLHNITPTEPAL